jgi:hypothetical protein
MWKILAVTFVLIFTSLASFSQDVIVLKNNGERIQAKVTEVGLTEIRYKNYDNQDGPTYIISKADVDMILYINGTKDVFIEEPANTDSTTTKSTTNENAAKTTNAVNSENPSKAIYTTNSSNNDLFRQGQTDAMKYYRGYRGAASTTFLVSLVGTPILGLIPAIACSVTTPHGRYLMCPNRELIQNSDYYTGYTIGAKRIKSRKVWANWGAACGIYIILGILYS